MSRKDLGKKLMGGYLIYRAGQASRQDEPRRSEPARPSGGRKSEGIGCTVVMLIVGGIAGILIYRLVHGL